MQHKQLREQLRCKPCAAKPSLVKSSQNIRCQKRRSISIHACRCRLEYTECSTPTCQCRCSSHSAARTENQHVPARPSCTPPGTCAAAPATTTPCHLRPRAGKVELTVQKRPTNSPLRHLYIYPTRSGRSVSTAPCCSSVPAS